MSLKFLKNPLRPFDRAPIGAVARATCPQRVESVLVLSSLNVMPELCMMMSFMLILNVSDSALKLTVNYPTFIP